MTTPMILDIKKKEICWFVYDNYVMIKHSFQVKDASGKFMDIIMLLSDNEYHSLKDISKFLNVKTSYGRLIMYRIFDKLNKNFNVKRVKNGYILYDHIELTY